MNNIIQYFSENGIEELEKIKLNFLKDPSHFEVCVMEVLGIFFKMACMLISEWLEECNTMLEASLKRQSCWHIKDRCQKSILTPAGTVYFTHTRFINKKTKKTAYLLDRIMGWKPHTRLSDGVKARILEAAAQGSYEKAGKNACYGEERVSKETVMRQVHKTRIAEKREDVPEKRKVKYLYVEADEDHIALQYKEKKGDIKRFKGHADNGQIVKLVYVHEGYVDGNTEIKRKKLGNIFYFGGLYRGKDNEKLWNEVKEYIEKHYEIEEIEKIYFQSDGGAWMKKGIEVLNAEFVLDEFHIEKYIRKMARLESSSTEKEQEETVKYLQECIEKGRRTELEKWVTETKENITEKAIKKLEECWKYIKNNWSGIRKRIKKEYGVIGSSTESHISHVISERMSSRPMGWCRKGADMLSQIRVYWKNGGNMLELVQTQEEMKMEEKAEEENYFSASEMLSWENRHKKTNGKYIEALRASVANCQMSAKVNFNTSILGIC